VNAQGAVQDQAQAANLTQSLIRSINAINIKQWDVNQVKQQANDFAMNGFRNFQSNLITSEQYGQIVAASQAKMQQAEQAANTITIPTVEEVSPAKPAPTKSRYPRIDTVFQTMLGVNPDGSLGPMTQSALDRYKASRNPGMSNELAFEYLKREPEYRGKRALPWDDNSNTYGSTANQIARENPF
jgi:hypothetical protein